MSCRSLHAYISMQRMCERRGDAPCATPHEAPSRIGMLSSQLHAGAELHVLGTTHRQPHLVKDILHVVQAVQPDVVLVESDASSEDMEALAQITRQHGVILSAIAAAPMPRYFLFSFPSSGAHDGRIP